jgi:hypothetical protein
MSLPVGGLPGPAFAIFCCWREASQASIAAAILFASGMAFSTTRPRRALGSRRVFPHSPDCWYQNSDNQHDRKEQRDLPAPRDRYNCSNRDRETQYADPHHRVIAALDPSVFSNPLRDFLATRSFPGWNQHRISETAGSNRRALWISAPVGADSVPQVSQRRVGSDIEPSPQPRPNSSMDQRSPGARIVPGDRARLPDRPELHANADGVRLISVRPCRGGRPVRPGRRS